MVLVSLLFGGYRWSGDELQSHALHIAVVEQVVGMERLESPNRPRLQEGAGSLRATRCRPAPRR